MKSVTESLANPIHYWDVNVHGTLNLLLTMKEYECYSFVFSSSATIYGLSDSVPISEDHRISPINPYGKTKVAIETIFYGALLLVGFPLERLTTVVRINLQIQMKFRKLT